jgi:hypothetical protein
MPIKFVRILTEGSKEAEIFARVQENWKRGARTKMAAAARQVDGKGLQ